MRLFSGWLIIIGFLLLTYLPILQANTVSESQCSRASYFCIDPQGTEFAVVGPVNMWFSQAEQGCIASPASHADGCSYIAQLCNRTYPRHCRGDCLAGNATSYVLERSCVGILPIYPSTSVPDVRHEIWYIK